MIPSLLKRLPLVAAALLALCAGASQAQSVALTDPAFSAASLGYPLSWSIGSGTPELVGGQLDLDAGDSVYQSFTLSARPTTCTSPASAPASCWTTSRSPRRFRNPRASR